MTLFFQINFRREAFRRERAEARRRALGLGVWLAYFGALAVLLGLYGLNCFALGTRTRQIERQVERQRALQQADADWMPPAGEAVTVEPWVADAGRWRDLLGRLPRILPAGARLTSLQWNREDVAGGERKLLLAGTVRVQSHRDRTAGVTDLVGVMTRDSLFAARFHSVRLLSTRASEDGAESEFQVECK